MSADFFAAILEGFEGTLDEVLAREMPPELRAVIDALLQHLVGVKEQLTVVS